MIRILLAGLFLLLLSAAAAKAQTCSASVSDVNFGAANVVAGAAVDTTATVSVNCNSMGGATVYVCPSLRAGGGGVSGGSRAMLGPGAAVLRYDLFRDGARSQPWGSADDPSLGTVPVVTVTDSGAGSGTASATIYARLLANQQTAPPGSYSSSFGGGQTDFVYGTASDCTGGAVSGTTAPAFAVLADPAPYCEVSVGNLSFGTHGVLDAAVDGSSTMSVACTSGTSYAVSLDDGLNGGSPATRKMSKGGEFLGYGLYQDAGRSLTWAAGVDAVAGTGAGSSQNLTVYGRVPAQATPSAGSYTDTVVATVTY